MPTLQDPHHCDHSGVANPYTDDWIERFDGDTDRLDYVIAKAAVDRVLYVLSVTRGYFH